MNLGSSTGPVSRARVSAAGLLWEPALVFGSVAVIHLSMIGQFGATWDEPLHRGWAQLFISYWRTGNMQILEEMPGLGIFYGPLYHVLNYELSELLYKVWHIPFVVANHVLTVMMFSLSCAFLFVMARTIYSRRTAWLSVLLLLLLPQLLAHAQYNPKDIPLMTVTTLTLFAGYEFLKRRTTMSAIAVGVCFGIALAVKLTAVMILPAFTTAYMSILWSSADRRTSQALVRDLRLAIIITLTSFAAVFALWPSLWFNIAILPRGFHSFLQPFWPNNVLYFGREYVASNLPWHYTLLSLIFTTPIPILVFFLIGAGVGIRRIWRREQVLEYTLLLSWLLLPLLLTMKPGIVRYDGYRQFFFTLPAMVILGAVGLESCAKAIGSRLPRWYGFTVPILAGVTALWVLIEIVQIFPYEGSYFNQLLRWPRGPHLERQFEIEYWGPTYKEGMQWLFDNAAPNPIICVPIAGGLAEWYPRRDDFRLNCTKDSDYVMYFPRKTFNRHYDFGDKQPVFEIERYNSRLLAIYKVR